MRGETMNLERVMYKLDILMFKLNNTITCSEGLHLIIIPKLVEEIERLGCVLKGKYVKSGRHVSLEFSCGNDHTCIYIELETTPIDFELDRLRAYYYVAGGKCGKFLEALRMIEREEREKGLFKRLKRALKGVKSHLAL
jgi:hypothetical protein